MVKRPVKKINWLSQIDFNLISKYHTYFCDGMYQHGSGQINGDPTNHTEAGPTNPCNNNVAISAFQMATAEDKDSSPSSLEEEAICQYQVPEDVSLTGDPQAHNQLQRNKYLQADSDYQSDIEYYIPPGTLSLDNSREANLPQVDLATWVTNVTGNETMSLSPVAEKVPSCHAEVPITTVIPEKEDTDLTAPGPSTALQKPGMRKPKARSAFSERQLNILLKYFSVQNYCSPAEMKILGEITGLAYKQVKTWFQNRRMKQRRLQKENSWVAENYATIKREPGCGPFFNNPQHVTSYQGEARPEFNQHYNQHQNMSGQGFQQNAPPDTTIKREPGGFNNPQHIPSYQGDTRPKFSQHYNQHQNMLGQGFQQNAPPDTTIKREPGCGPFFNNPQHIPSYQGDTRPKFNQHYNQHQNMLGQGFQQNAPPDTTIKKEPGCGPFFKQPQHIPSYQGDARPKFNQHYNQHQNMSGTAFQQSTLQDLDLYLASMDSATGSSSYPSWPPGPAQAAIAPKPEAAGWSMPTETSQCEYNPCAFNTTNIVSANNIGVDAGLEDNDGEDFNF